MELPMIFATLRRGVAIAALLAACAAAPPSRGADAPLGPEANAFKDEGIPDCVSNYVYRGLEYEAARAKCDCVFEFYARHLTPGEMADVSAMAKIVRVKTGDRNDPVVIAGANALMRVSHDMLRACEIK
jgi:hypothetical protein